MPPYLDQAGSTIENIGDAVSSHAAVALHQFTDSSGSSLVGTPGGGTLAPFNSDSSGYWLCGLSSHVTQANGAGTYDHIQVSNENSIGSGIGWFESSNGTSCAAGQFYKTRGTTATSHVALQVGDGMGEFDTWGSDGTQYIGACWLTAYVDATVSTNIVPGSWVCGVNDNTGAPKAAWYVDHLQNFYSAGVVAAGMISTGSSVNKAPGTPGTFGFALYCNGNASIVHNSSLLFNACFHGGAWHYLDNGYAIGLSQVNGDFAFNTAPNNTGGGDAIATMTERFRIMNGGGVEITGTAAGTAALTVNTSGTTGAQTATFTATNKPGTGTTTPSKWLPIVMDGTTYYIPAWQ